MLKKIIKTRINKLPYIKAMREKLEKIEKKYNALHVPPGHYYSPIVSTDELKKRENQIWSETQKQVLGINLNESEQLNLLNELAKFYVDLPFSDQNEKKLRYRFHNNMYTYSDGIFLYSMIRKFRPKRIIEIGSGFSSALMLDVNDLFFDNQIACTFIEPYPERLKSLLKEGENINLIEQPAQSVNLKTFDQLEQNDFLFIDSSHVSKTGSDVNFILFEILPRLKKGVKIHFHDIFYPFEYPKDWVLEKKRNWNEDYILRAFLSYNDKFKIILFNTFLEEFHENWFKQHMPLCLKNKGGSIWLEVQ